jgi:hypothetical protein
LETLEIKLTDQTVARLEAAAERLGLTPEQLLEISLEEKLFRLDKDFLDAAQYTTLDKDVATISVQTCTRPSASTLMNQTSEKAFESCVEQMLLAKSPVYRTAWPACTTATITRCSTA